MRPETVESWQAAGVDAFTAALAQADGFGPVSGRHELPRLRAVARTWSEEGLDGVDGIEWHRAGFVAAEAKRWIAEGFSLSDAAVAAGKRMRG